jgi:hypothetical protein
MRTATQWDHEVDVLCIGTTGGVLAAGVVAASAGCDVYLGISEPTAGGSYLAASLGYRGADNRRLNTFPDLATRSTRSIAGRPCGVNGQLKLPVGGQENCP